MVLKSIVFVTGNPDKLRETSAILLSGDKALDNFTLESKNFDLPELQGTTQEVAREKCRRAAELVNGPCIIEDSALCFEALGGLPGVYIKHFVKQVGLDGLNTMLNSFPTRNATAICTFAYSEGPDTEPILFEGRTEGRIVPPRGPGNFGWQPIFEANETGKTFAEMTPEEKNGISHRSRALDKVQNYLKGDKFE